MRLPIRILAPVAALAAVALGAPGPAAASSTQLSIIQDDRQFLLNGAAERAQRLDEVDRLGVDVVKVLVNWRNVAPEGDSASRPWFDAASPAGYSSARFEPYDDLVRQARARGLRVMFMLGGSAPDWASKPSSRTHAGKNYPSAAEFGQFVRAVGRRYSGGYSDDATGGPIPRVSMWSVWNEPNIPGWLYPQFGRRRVPVSPRIYRGLLKSAYSALSATGHRRDLLLLGELAPFASNSRTTMRPLHFLRELACVNSRHRPYRGRAARKRGCSSRGSSPRLPGTALAYHPYAFGVGPRRTRVRHRDDATYAQIGRITKTLDRVRKRFRSRSRKRVYMTESGFETNPPDPFRGQSLFRASTSIGEGEWMLFKNRRVASTSQYPLVDDPVSSGDFGGFHSGLVFGPGSGRQGEQKPGVYDAYRLPFFTRVRGRRIELFGAARPASSGETVQIQYRRGSGWRRVATVKVNSRGYFRRYIRSSRTKKRRTYRFVYQDDGVERSSQARRPSSR